jgi:hypothetical protein
MAANALNFGAICAQKSLRWPEFAEIPCRIPCLQGILRSRVRIGLWCQPASPSILSRSVSLLNNDGFCGEFGGSSPPYSSLRYERRRILPDIAPPSPHNTAHTPVFERIGPETGAYLCAWDLVQAELHSVQNFASSE